MCPSCFAGPLLNEHCADLRRHHGDCPKCMTKIDRADASIAEGLRRLGAGGAGGARVCDVLPKCGQCQLTVLFNGCGACGMLFDAMRWDELPVWDDGARDRLEMVTRGRHAARLLAAQANFTFLSN